MSIEILKQKSLNPLHSLMGSFIISVLVLSGCQTNEKRTGEYPAMDAKQSDINACNTYAGRAAGTKDATTEVAKDAAIGGAGGAGLGAVGGAIGGSAGTGAAVGAVVGVATGALYGLNENRKNDEVYQDSYRRCMQDRGY